MRQDAKYPADWRDEQVEGLHAGLADVVKLFEHTRTLLEEATRAAREKDEQLWVCRQEIDRLRDLAAEMRAQADHWRAVANLTSPEMQRGRHAS